MMWCAHSPQNRVVVIWSQEAFAVHDSVIGFETNQAHYTVETRSTCCAPGASLVSQFPPPCMQQC